MTIKHLIVPSLLALTIAACSPSSTDTSDASKPAASQVAAKAVLGSFGIAQENMDLSVKPGDNFFEYVNGTWLANAEIPADKSSYGSFSLLGDLSDERVKAIIEEASAETSASGSETQKIGDFYAAFMDVDGINAAGLAPVQADLDLIKSVKSH